MKPRCASTNVAAAKPCPAGTGLCATGIVLRAKTGISHWDITVRGGHPARGRITDSDVKLTGAATLVADIDLL